MMCSMLRVTPPLSVPFMCLSLEGRHFKFHQEVGNILVSLLGPQYVNDIVVARNTPHLIGELDR